ncbi:GNAT family N-acetyltransferase [Ornithinibacillus halotolerans]|uniref:N-acetyltransferase n=1 Tax=Ornithinibacillus halotolerans TaxID=1274357 RepID=A0A916RZB3_9BACI|nr:GNAT family N-acetyltransferase [Ornithinibacillus halotolerans]GGA77812.1 N-acetyltransferase [Ornithinibacillus halotolerans]
MIHVLTSELARKIEESEIEALQSRLTAIKEIPGNPLDAEIVQFGNATAFTIKGIPGPSFNTVRGITSNDMAEVDDILTYYKERGIPIQFELTPASTNSKLMELLATKGLYQHKFHSVLYGIDKDIHYDKNSSIIIRKLAEDEFDLFAEIYARGFGLPNIIKAGIAQNNKILHSLDAWDFYIALMNEKPVGIGVLFVANGVATLAASATLPEHRNNGVHQALLQERVKDAKDKGANLIVGQAKFASTSSNNMERMGLKLAYTKSIWVEKREI